MRRLLLAAAALGFVASIGTAYATPDTSNTVEMWNLASVPGGDQNSGALVQQALPSAEAAILSSPAARISAPWLTRSQLITASTSVNNPLRSLSSSLTTARPRGCRRAAIRLAGTYG